jgi:hypothetical protein
MTFNEKVTLIRADVSNPNNSIDNSSIYNELLLRHADQQITLLQTIINIFKGIEPSLLSGGATNLSQVNGVQVGNLNTSEPLNVNPSSVFDVNISNTPEVLIKGAISGQLADVNAVNQLKTTVIP